MGPIATALLWKFAFELAKRILDNDENMLPIEAAEKAIVQLQDIRGGLKNADELLLAADDVQTKRIIDSMFDLVVGIANAPAQLIAAFLGLLGGKKGSQ